MRPGIRFLCAVVTFGSATVARAQDSVCVTVRDGASQREIASALVRIEGDNEATREVWSDAVGRACWSRDAMPGSRRVLASALGYRGASRDVGASGTGEVVLERALGPRSDGAIVEDREWRRGQFEVVVASALRELRSCVSRVIASCTNSFGADTATPSDLSLFDSAASAGSRARLGSIGIALEHLALRLRAANYQPPQLLRERSRVTLVAYVDVPDSADRYTELRVAIPSGAGRASFGATEMMCAGQHCERRRQLSLTWVMDEERRLAADVAIATDGLQRTMDVFDLSGATGARVARAATSASPSGGQSVLVRGVVRDEKGRPLRDAQILASPAGTDTRADSSGRFVLRVPPGASTTLLTARAIGYAPVYRVVVATGDTGISWEPRLRSVQQLAERIVRAAGLPARLSSWRYDEMMARRAKGRGYFMLGEEIWSSTAIGDAIARVPGVRVRMGHTNNIELIVMARCSRQKISDRFLAPEGRIGVWVNGYEQTQALTAELVLADIGINEVIAMEVYRGMSEMPAEYASARYCGVISVWTR